jgi:hypothetical protein
MESRIMEDPRYALNPHLQELKGQVISGCADPATNRGIGSYHDIGSWRRYCGRIKTALIESGFTGPEADEAIAIYSKGVQLYDEAQYIQQEA